MRETKFSGKNQPVRQDDTILGLFEFPNAFIRQAVAACRLFNTAVDAVFYDVPTLRADFLNGTSSRGNGAKSCRPGLSTSAR